MAKRTKTVFKNSAECIAAYVKQNQDFGVYKCTARNGGGKLTPVYFRGENLYSFGSHYLLARIGLSLNGKPIAVVNFSKYSNTTSGQSNDAYDALRDAGYTVLSVESELSLREGESDSNLIHLAIRRLETRAEYFTGIQGKPLENGGALKQKIVGFNLLVSELGLENLAVKINDDLIQSGVNRMRKIYRARDDHRSRIQLFFVLAA